MLITSSVVYVVKCNLRRPNIPPLFKSKLVVAIQYSCGAALFKKEPHNKI